MSLLRRIGFLNHIDDRKVEPFFQEIECKGSAVLV